MKCLFTRIVNCLALCLLFCLLAACQQDPTIVEIVYVQEEADAKPQAPSQVRPEINAADANTPGSALSPSSEEPAPAPEETKNPLLDIQIPTPSFLPFPTPSPMPTPTLFPTPTPAVRTPAPTTPPPTTTPAATPVPEPTLSQNNDLERERLAAANAQEVESIQRKYDSKAADLQSMLSSMEASLAANPEYAAEIQQEIQSVQLQLQQVESHRSQELQATQTAYQQALAALG